MPGGPGRHIPGLEDFGAASAADLATAAAAIAQNLQWCGLSGGTAGAQTLTVGTPVTLVTGLTIAFQAGWSSISGLTLNVGGTGAHSVRKPTIGGGSAYCSGNEIQIYGIYVVRYDLGIECWVLQSGFTLQSNDIPPTLGDTNFSAIGINKYRANWDEIGPLLALARSYNYGAAIYEIHNAAGEILIFGVGSAADPTVEAQRRMAITSAGRVGIGTIAPTCALDVAGSIKASGSANSLGETSFSESIVAANNNGIRTSSNANALYLLGGTSANPTYGALVLIYGADHAISAGKIILQTTNSPGALISMIDKNAAERLRLQEDGVAALSPVISVGTSFTTICAITGNQSLRVATVTGIGSILLEWDGTTLTKLAGVASLVVAGSAGAGETAFRVSGGNLQAIVDTSTRNVSSGFSVRH